MDTSIKIQVKQRESWNPTIANIGKEIFDMYWLTVGQWVSKELQLFIVYFFLQLNYQDKNILDIILWENIDKLQAFDKALESKQRYLNKWEYFDFKEEYGVKNLLQYDVIFLLIDVIIHRESFEKKAESFFSTNDMQIMKRVVATYRSPLESFFMSFETKYIKDERYDEEKWEYIDLSKSVYRPIYMRLSKTLSMPLQKNAEFKQLTKNSPLVLEIFQLLDVKLVLTIRESLHLMEYISWLWPEIQNFIKEGAKFALNHLDFDINIPDIIIGIIWFYLGKKSEKKERKQFQDKINQLETQLLNHNQSYSELQNVLKQSILNVEDSRTKRIIQVKAKIEAYQEMEQNVTTRRQIKKLKGELKKLENIEVNIQEFNENKWNR